MDTKFTKGPWFNQDYSFEIEAKDCCIPIAKVTVFNEGKANAHLIAASPDMYKALESHLNTLGDLYALDIDDVLPEHEGEFRAVHALINKTELLLKKARGE